MRIGWEDIRRKDRKREKRMAESEKGRYKEEM